MRNKNYCGRSIYRPLRNHNRKPDKGYLSRQVKSEIRAAQGLESAVIKPTRRNFKTFDEFRAEHPHLPAAAAFVVFMLIFGGTAGCLNNGESNDNSEKIKADVNIYTSADNDLGYKLFPQRANFTDENNYTVNAPKIIADGIAKEGDSLAVHGRVHSIYDVNTDIDGDGKKENVTSVTIAVMHPEKGYLFGDAVNTHYRRGSVDKDIEKGDLVVEYTYYHETERDSEKGTRKILHSGDPNERSFQGTDLEWTIQKK